MTDSRRDPWRFTLDVADVWNRPDGVPFAEWRDQLVRRVKASRWYTSQDEDSPLREVVDELSDVETVPEFDAVWADLYTAADIDRVWVKTL